MACCPSPREAVVKRWEYNGKFYSIIRCRRCRTWSRREIEMREIDGKLTDTMKTVQLHDN